MYLDNNPYQLLIMTVAQRIIQFYQHIQPPTGLPSRVVTLNPYKDEKACQLADSFYRKFYSDQQERYALLGINPGRFGGGVTGVPFTDPIRLEEDCGIPNDLDKKPELSSRFIYDVIQAYSGPEAFYGKFYFSAISPLGFVQDNKNLNYYDIPNWRDLFESYAVARIKEQFDLPINRNVVFCIGQGKNLQFLEYLNKKHKLFQTITTVPHPRWVMQYRLKRKEEFVAAYLQTLEQHTS